MVGSDVLTRQEAPLAEDCTAALALCALTISRVQTSLVSLALSTGFTLSAEAVDDPYGDVQLGGEIRAKRTSSELAERRLQIQNSAGAHTVFLIGTLGTSCLMFKSSLC